MTRGMPLSRAVHDCFFGSPTGHAQVPGERTSGKVYGKSGLPPKVCQLL